MQPLAVIVFVLASAAAPAVRVPGTVENKITVGAAATSGRGGNLFGTSIANDSKLVFRKETKCHQGRHPGIHQPGPPKAFGLRLALSPVHPRYRQPSGSWEAGVQGSPREIGNQGVRASHHGFVPTPHRACSGHELCLIRDH